MTGSVVARRYAAALFDLARESGGDSLETTDRDIEAIAALTRENAELARLFRDPVFSPEETRKVLTALAEQMQLCVAVRDFCYLLADKRRLSLLAQIAEEYQILADESKGIMRGEFISAVPLNKEKQDAVRAELTKKASHTLELDFKVDKALLGGMVLKLGDNVMDASLKTQLTFLTDTIKRGE
ncbi:ATP synthase subunit delta [Deltaproteobacteria bacterium]|nr:ATP synthase subunit delta [Deltaproteobacteria bacterium]